VVGGLRHTVELNELCRGSHPLRLIRHEVYAEGVDVLGQPVTSGRAQVALPVAFNGELSIDTQASSVRPGGTGDELAVDVLVCNTGDASVTGLRLQVDAVWPAYTFGALEPGECVASFDLHGITAEEEASGVAEVYAHAWGDHPCGCTVEAACLVEVELE
jgi:hypothetical protein